MSFRRSTLVTLALATLATAQLGCNQVTSLLNALNDGGTAGGGADGGGGTGGGDAMDGGAAAAKGSVAITFNCMGDACGKMGNIIARVKACGAGGAVSKSDESLTSQTLAMGTPIMLTIADVDAGSFCLRTYLDVNANKMQDTGDVIPAMEEVPITVMAGMPTAVAVDLTMVKP